MSVKFAVRVLIVTERQASAHSLKALFTQAGCAEIAFAFSYQDVLRELSAILPHFIAIDGDLPDFNGISLVQKLRVDKLWENTPIVVMRTLTKEDILKLVEAKISVILKKPLDTAQVLTKVSELVTKIQTNPAYRMAVPDAILAKAGVLRFRGVFVARKGGLVVCRGPFQLAAGQQVIVAPEEDSAQKFISTVSQSEADPSRPQEFLHYFPVAGSIGAKRTWLAEVAAQPAAAPVREKKLLCFEPKTERVASLNAALTYYDVQATVISNFQSLVSIFSADLLSFPIVYFSSPLMGAQSANWKTLIDKLPLENRPLEVIATTATTHVLKAKTAYLTTPFSIETLIQTLDAGYEMVWQSSAGAKQSSAAGSPQKSRELPLSFSVAANLRCVDERGVYVSTAQACELPDSTVFEHVAFAGQELFSKWKRPTSVKSEEDPGQLSVPFQSNKPLLEMRSALTKIFGAKP